MQCKVNAIVIFLLIILGVGPLLMLYPQSVHAMPLSYGPAGPLSISATPSYNTVQWDVPSNVQHNDGVYAAAGSTGGKLCPDGWWDAQGGGTCGPESFTVVDPNDPNYLYLYRVSNAKGAAQLPTWFILYFTIHSLVSQVTGWYIGVYGTSGDYIFRTGPFTTTGIGYYTLNSGPINMYNEAVHGVFYIAFTRNTTNTPAMGVGTHSACGMSIHLSSWDISWPGQIVPTCSNTLMVDSVMVNIDYSPSDFIFASNYGFNLPSNAQIQGVQLVVWEYASDDSSDNYVSDAFVALGLSGGSCGNSKALIAPTYKWDNVRNNVFYGADNDTWGCPLTAATVNSPTFGVLFEAMLMSEDGVGVSAYVDWLGLTVYYTLFSSTTQTSSTYTVTGGGEITIDAYTSSNSTSFGFTHAANTLVILSVGTTSYPTGGFTSRIPTAATIEGDSMTLLDYENYTDIVNHISMAGKVWYSYRMASGTESIAETGGSGTIHSTVLSYINTVASPPYFEDETKIQCGGFGGISNCAIIVAAGTARRTVFAADTEFSWGGLMTLKTNGEGVIEVQNHVYFNSPYYAGANAIEDTAESAGSTTLEVEATVASNVQAWTMIAAGILPGSAAGTTTYTTTYPVGNTTRTCTPGSCEWPELFGSVHTAEPSAISWLQNVIWQQGPSASASCVGQRGITSTVPADNTWLYIYKDSGGQLAAVTSMITGLQAAGLVIRNADGWSTAQGAVISDIIKTGGYDWAVVAVQNAAADGVNLVVLKITEAPDQYSYPSIVIDSVRSASYMGASGHTVSIISDAQLFPTNHAYVSFSYNDGSYWQIEEYRFDNIWGSGTPGELWNDQIVNWDHPVSLKYAYSPDLSMVVGVYSSMHFGEYGLLQWYQVQNETEFGSTGSILAASELSAGPASIIYDAMHKWFIVAGWTSSAHVELMTLWHGSNGWGWNDFTINDPFSSDLMSDCLDLKLIGNRYGLVIIIGLFSDNYIHYVYSFDGGDQNTWQGSSHTTLGRDWFYGITGYLGELPMRIDMPSYMQPTDFTFGSLGYGLILEVDNSWLITRTIQYLPVKMTFTGSFTTTFTGTSTSAINTNIVLKTTAPGTTIISTTWTATVVSDVPITPFIYAAIVIFSMFGAALAIERSILAVCCGLSIGITLAIVLNLIPAYSIALVLLLGAVALFFSR